jgi:hypothetical protein
MKMFLGHCFLISQKSDIQCIFSGLNYPNHCRIAHLYIENNLRGHLAEN